MGSNVFALFPQASSLASPIILGGAFYLLAKNWRLLIRLLSFPDYLLAVSLLLSPVILTLLFRFTSLGENRTIIGRSGSFYAAVALVFIVSSLIALPLRSKQTIVWSAFAIVALSAALNLFELFISPNTWSNAPGRSAGLFYNPNQSASVLLGYGLVFLVYRQGKLRAADFVVISMICLGVFLVSILLPLMTASLPLTRQNRW